LGHPSTQALSRLSNYIQKNVDGHKDELCEVCLRAKQTHLAFPISGDTALNNSYLIYYDIWGAYRVKAFWPCFI